MIKVFWPLCICACLVSIPAGAAEPDKEEGFETVQALSEAFTKAFNAADEAALKSLFPSDKLANTALRCKEPSQNPITAMASETLRKLAKTVLKGHSLGQRLTWVSSSC